MNDEEHYRQWLSAWLRHYPAEYHAVLSEYGGDDRGNQVLIAYNKHVMRVYDDYQHHPQPLLNQRLEDVRATWEPVCELVDGAWKARIEEARRGGFEWTAPWLPNPCATDSRIFRHDEAAVEWLAEHTGIKFSERMFARLRDEGRGPNLVGSPLADLPSMCRWASFAFDIPAEGPARLDHQRVLQPLKTKAPGAPDWLIAANDSEETDMIVRLLECIGANIMRVHSPLEAAQAVTMYQFHGMIMRFNHRIEAECAIAFICMEESIPFIIITNGPSRPASMGRGGVVLHDPRSASELSAALESLPAARLVGLELPDDGAAAERHD
ncbi:hypothetical protein [Methylobacterium oxalidis]|uniref:hypothetical protein n=1 Tax=Methylobacterium oxalidis TaxID=944322 RepID=UPI0033156225